MTTENEGGETSAKVAKLATKQTRLDRIALIGIFGSTTKPGALVRITDGTVLRVTVGDRVEDGVVKAIGEDQVILSRRGGLKMLKLPQS